MLFLVVSLGTVAACSSGEPELTPLPTEAGSSNSPEGAAAPSVPSEPPLTAPPPESESEAIAMGKTVTEMYFEVVKQITNEHPEDTSLLNDVARDEAAQQVLDAAAQLVSEGKVYTHDVAFEINESETRVSGETEGIDAGAEFIYVEFYGCSALTDEHDADSGEQRSPAWVLARYYPEEQAWFVSNTKARPDADVAYTC